jgi:hypothetical protein
MRTLLIVLALSLSGCATGHFSDIFNPEATQKRREADAQDRQERADARRLKEQAQANLGPGSTKSEVIAAWDEPERTEFDENFSYFWYQNSGEPVVFKFDKADKLVGYTHDVASEREIRQRRFQSQLIRQQRLQNIQNAFAPRPTTTCTSNRNGLTGQVTTTCQ